MSMKTRLGNTRCSAFPSRPSFVAFLLLSSVAIIAVTMVDLAAHAFAPDSVSAINRSSRAGGTSWTQKEPTSSTGPPKSQSSKSGRRPHFGLVPSQVRNMPTQQYHHPNQRSDVRSESYDRAYNSTDGGTATLTRPDDSVSDHVRNNGQYSASSGRERLNNRSRDAAQSRRSHHNVPGARQNQQRQHWNSNSSRNSYNSNKKKFGFRVYGDLPDIHWRAISMDHLRLHPLFEPLPLAEDITNLEKLEDVRNFRQDSWQWDALHSGRCTTSQASAALGFLEPQTATQLGIPSSWQRGGQGAFHRLSQKALRSLQDMAELLEHDDPDATTRSTRHGKLMHAGSEPPSSQHGNKPIWVQPNQNAAHTRPFPFAAKYLVKMTAQECGRRRHHVQNVIGGYGREIKMSWGNAQEPTSILTALNYFWEKDPNIRIKEVGMCGAGLAINTTSTSDAESAKNIDGSATAHDPSSLLVGASPDALICYPNGTIEVLEVKNHCPFFTSNGKHEFAIREFPFREPYLPSHYVPQLMMEMMCVGQECRSAIMIRQTATGGALIIRLHRDDEWLDEMMFWLSKFQIDFVQTGTLPPVDFFYNDPNLKGRYGKFIEHTVRLGLSVEKLDHVPHAKIQRMMGVVPGMTPLYLDL